MTPLQKHTVDRYRAGAPIRQIAAEDGVNFPTICLRLKRAQEPARPNWRPRLPVFDIIDAYERLQSWQAVADTLGFNSHMAAWTRARSAGFKSRHVSQFRLLTPRQREIYRAALDVDRLQHADAYEIAREYR